MCIARFALGFALIIPSLALAQSFAITNITPSVSSDPRESRLQILPTGELIGHSVPVIELLSLAYGVPENPSPRLSSLPEWTVRQRFDIHAKTPLSLKLEAKNIVAQKQTIQQLLRKLLADRFGLVLNVRTERVSVYALYLMNGAPKLSSAATDCILDTSPQGCHSFSPGFGHPFNARAVDMSDLASYLENWTDLPVVDRTAQDGLFSMHSQGWRPMNLPPPPPGSVASGDEFATLPSLSSVLARLGLRLRRQEETLPFYRVERVHQPMAK